ncbi:MAG: hypothetical protein COV31_00795 [Candidatus Yanofskybacteria bacterium CG10_big_fil_rev_8_21_14_0_10_46_23]|uniref:Type IV secretion system coupling protein TraD DNA-binding domain-containing protein n=1 Tax=Candidatus Yanofskybacteria bacterium CG10_big_fil_rev_8_21_14_0_10_46_23 TaxID=1975098 RepID=A0A2H0R6E8_9BACT|nr:MAG: hypothetical protein COV31_00795 [Candidatus Yanofskybacteria bacterium CG10_big_fil_rev_8_21_14_0_10_46_23]
MNKDEVVLFAETNFRNQRQRFGIRTDDRRRHMYIIGKTGMGKTALLRNMLIQDIQEGRGLAFIDPHGDVADDLLDYIPEDRIKDVIYFNPVDTEFPVSFNILEKVDAKDRHLVASGLMSAFKKIWQDLWSARMEYILNNTILALLEVEGSTILGVNRMFADKKYRKEIVDQITDPIVKAFWVNEFAQYTERLAVEATAAIQNKIGQFTSSTLIRNIVGQTHTAFDVRQAMDSKKIIILNLARGRIGEDASRLLGTLFITKIQLGAMSRANVPESEREDFFLYVDEFQNFATESFASILSEARKFRLSLTVAHQYIAQMEEEVRDAVFGNVGTIITFRIGAEDAEAIEKEFEPEFIANDLINLPKYEIYLKLMIDGVASKAFSAHTMPPLEAPAVSFRDKIVETTRSRYGTPRDRVEDQISKWTKVEEAPIRSQSGSNKKKSNNYSQPSTPKDNLPKPTPGVLPLKEPVQTPRSVVTPPKEMPVSQALSKLPVDFRGKKLPETKTMTESISPKAPDLDSLREILKKAMGE